MLARRKRFLGNFILLSERVKLILICLLFAQSSHMRPGIIFSLCFVLLSLNSDYVDARQVEDKVEKKTCKVFLLAGQSNMVGHAVVDLDDPKNYNSGQGNLESLFANEKKQGLVAHLGDGNGNWTKRNDVFIRFQSSKELKVGPLSVGYTNHDGQHHFGPELQFGNIVGDHFDEPVLLLKTAWGGKSLDVDFASPSSGKTGEYYTKMIDEFRQGLEKIESEIPQLAGHELEIVGFVWMQGWNDMCNKEAVGKYSVNLIRFVNDVREELGIEDLPFVVGELGNGGKAKKQTAMFRFRRQQEEACVHSPFVGNVDFVPTIEFARPADRSPNVTHGHHWFGNAESYFLVGDALGKHMLRLMAVDSKTRVLILGDSISIGYTPLVRKLMPETFIVRPMKTARVNENCQGTNNGIKNIDKWLAIGGGNWDVIHFNFGLHDLKHVQPDSGKNSNDPNHPQQANPQQYAKQLEEITVKLKATGAKLIFATTTPIPEGGVKPHRALDAPAKYNSIAKEIMKRHGIEVNDLNAVVAGREAELMRPANVHFKPAGSQILAERVANSINSVLSAK